MSTTYVPGVARPPNVYQQVMPQRAQDILARYGVLDLPALEIMLDDDLRPVVTAERFAEYAINVLMGVKPTPLASDLLDVAIVIAAHFGRLTTPTP